MQDVEGVMGEPSEEKGNTETIETEKQSAYRYVGSSVKNDTHVFELQIEQGMSVSVSA